MSLESRCSRACWQRRWVAAPASGPGAACRELFPCPLRPLRSPTCLHPPNNRPPAVMSDYKVELVEDNISEFHVVFRGPPDSASRRQGQGAVGLLGCHCRGTAIAVLPLLLLDLGAGWSAQER